MSEIKDKIRKLLAHAESEKKIGNADAASAYRKKAESLLRTNNLTRRALKEPETFHVAGEWICSCGARISLDLQCAAAGIAKLANMILAPHHAQGHRLRKTT